MFWIVIFWYQCWFIWVCTTNKNFMDLERYYLELGERKSKRTHLSINQLLIQYFYSFVLMFRNCFLAYSFLFNRFEIAKGLPFNIDSPLKGFIGLLACWIIYLRFFPSSYLSNHETRLWIQINVWLFRHGTKLSGIW